MEVFVRLDSSVFLADEKVLRPFLQLLRCFTTGRHDWVVDPSTAKLAEEYLSLHCPRLAPSVRELTEKALVGGIWGAGASSGVVVNAESIESHVDDLEAPAILVLEDIVNDKSFLRSMIEIFAFDRLRTALNENWLICSHAGGSRIETVAVEEAGRFKCMNRVVVVMDSDRMIPGQITDGVRKADKLSAAGIKVHVLRLREAENYVPNKVLQLIGRKADSSKKLNHLKKLSFEQRGYFDMKSGFGRFKTLDDLKCLHESVFDGVSPETFKGLRDGFGKSILATFEDCRGSLRIDDLRCLGEEAVSEMKDLLRLIESVV